MLEIVGIYLIVGILFALRASHYGQNPAGVPATAYLITIIAWPYTLYLTLFVYGDKE